MRPVDRLRRQLRAQAIRQAAQRRAGPQRGSLRLLESPGGGGSRSRSSAQRPRPAATSSGPPWRSAGSSRRPSRIAVNVDGRAAGDHAGDGALVEAAAGDDPRRDQAPGRRAAGGYAGRARRGRRSPPSDVRGASFLCERAREQCDITTVIRPAEAPRGVPSCAQISAASSGWALPLKTAISRTGAHLARSITGVTEPRHSAPSAEAARPPTSPGSAGRPPPAFGASLTRTSLRVSDCNPEPRRAARAGVAPPRWRTFRFRRPCDTTPRPLRWSYSTWRRTFGLLVVPASHHEQGVVSGR